MPAWINVTKPGCAWWAEMPDDGDQWISWEQMVAQLRAKGEAEGRAALLAREVVELRGEVAKLKLLESLRSRLCAALGLPADSAPETVAEAVEARRVVVPELTSQVKDILWDLESHRLSPLDWKPFSVAATATAAWFRDNIRAIPDSRVLGEGMVQVDTEYLTDLEDSVRQLMGEKLEIEWDLSPMPERIKQARALRANQGGAEHG